MKMQAKKSLGQNWLSNPRILDRIVEAAEINSNDTVIEIGPGTGNLTEKLVQKAGTVIAIEKDNRLIGGLEGKFQGRASVKIIEEDILKLKIEEIIGNSKYKVVGNIPYYLTSHLIRTIFEEWPRPELIVLTIQKEVAQRMVAKPPHTNLLALSIQYYSEPKIISYVSKNNFQPVPKVDSAIIKLVLRDKYESREKAKKLFNLIKLGFSEKRKQLAPIISKKLKVPKEKVIEAFNKEGIRVDARAENLSLENWTNLQENLNSSYN
jgi:16S rRNA (adenine1518-N6/adenine1519-N6)-dimethyltransferase